MPRVTTLTDPRQELPRATTAAGSRIDVATRTGPRVSVVVAALNEEISIRHVLPLIPDDVYEVILVDGHSTDDTVAVARAAMPDIRVVYQPGSGKGDALRHGFDIARGDMIVALDADGSTDPREIPAFVGALLAGADYVKGTRFSSGAGTSDMTLTRKLGNKGLLLVVRMLFGARYTDLCYGYTAFWRGVLPDLRLRSTGFEIETEMNIRAALADLRVVEVASFEHDRIGGEAHLRPFQDGWRVLMEILRHARTIGVREPAPGLLTASEADSASVEGN